MPKFQVFVQTWGTVYDRYDEAVGVDFCKELAPARDSVEEALADMGPAREAYIEEHTDWYIDREGNKKPRSVSAHFLIKVRTEEELALETSSPRAFWKHPDGTWRDYYPDNPPPTAPNAARHRQYEPRKRGYDDDE